MRRILSLIAACTTLSTLTLQAQQQTPPKPAYTHNDTLRGSIGPERAWWDLLKYELQVTPDYTKKSISGENIITFKALTDGQVMQIDLQEPMKLVSATWRKKPLPFTREGNVFHLTFPKSLPAGSVENISLRYAGAPRVAVNPPWDGGWIWTTDEQGRPWMTVADEGLGASSWFPCKDHRYDEPDSGVIMHITVPDSLVGVGNGRLRNTHGNGDGTTTYTWIDLSPVNSYDIIPYVGKYASWSSEFQGEKGRLDCSFWVMDYNIEKARPQFKQADTMLRAFEYWMGPYPFYEDGYKLVEAPHLGMEHQSNIAYGNHFANGYRGRDLSATGWGLKWDFIIVHESGHEWFGNNITDKDAADMWIHESFTNYSETLYTTWLYGVEAGNDYCLGTRRMIANLEPIIADYGVNKESETTDMYYKGGNMLHMIRQIIGDSAFRGMLRGLNRQFYHQTVTSKQVEEYMSQYTHRDLSKIFDQYLRGTKVPILQYQSSGDIISYRWSNCVPGFNMPVKVYVGELPEKWITPTDQWQTMPAGTAGKVAETPAYQAVPVTPPETTGSHRRSEGPGPGIWIVGQTGNGSGGDINFSVDRNFYVVVKKQG
jgi:aminopeptidase N